MAKWRIIASDVNKRLRLVANTKSYHVQQHSFNKWAGTGFSWESVQHAPLAIGQEAAARMLHRHIRREAEAHQRASEAYRRVYQDLADSVDVSMKRSLGELAARLGRPATAEDLVAATTIKHYHRGAQRGRVTLPQPVTAGSNRGD